MSLFTKAPTYTAAHLEDAYCLGLRSALLVFGVPSEQIDANAEARLVALVHEIARGETTFFDSPGEYLSGKEPLSESARERFEAVLSRLRAREREVAVALSRRMGPSPATYDDVRGLLERTSGA